MNLKRLIFASLILVALLFACEPPGAPSVKGGGDIEDPTATPTPEVTTAPTATPGPDEIYSITVYAEADGVTLEDATYIFPAKASYATNDTPQIGIKSVDGYNFINWTGDVPAGKEQNVSFSVTVTDSDLTIIAHFKAIEEPTPTPEVSTEIEVGFNQLFLKQLNPQQSAAKPATMGLFRFTNVNNASITFDMNEETGIINIEPGFYYMDLISGPEGFNLDSLEFSNAANIPNIIPSGGRLIAVISSDVDYTGLQLTATFLKFQNSLSVYINNIDFFGPNSANIVSGTVTLSTGTTLAFADPTDIDVTATPNSGYQLESWQIINMGDPTNPITLDASGTDTITVDGDCYLNITFSEL